MKNYDKNFTVGPAKLFPGVADFLSEKLHDGTAELSHRSAEFSDISKNTLSTMREFFNIPDDYRTFYLSSSTESWEIVARGCVNKKTAHVTNGNFGEHWKKMYDKMNLEVKEISHGDWRTRVDVDEIKIDSETELLALTANETSSGISYSNDEIAKLRQKFPEILFGVDVTSSMGGVAYDFTQADIWHFSVQKGLGLPAGLGVLVLSPRAWEKYLEKAEYGADTGCHHSLGSLEGKMAGKFQTPTTPNVLGIYGLGFVCAELIKKFGSIDKLHGKLKARAERLYNFFESHSKFSIVPNKGRSETILVLECSEADIEKLHPFFGQAWNYGSEGVWED